MRMLIADFDPGRSRALADGCTARGHVVEHAAHGATALEVALEVLPEIIVCPIDLPVIDGAQLAEILRANPRTRHASFIFLVKDDLDAPMGMDPRDATVVSPWCESDVLDHIDAILERSARFGEARPDTEIEGKLAQISIVDLLQIFQMNQKSGTLRIWRTGTSGSGSILLREGQVIDASVPLEDGTCIVGEKAVYRLFGWKEGRFEFVPGVISEAARIQKPPRALLMEGMRQVDEWEKLRRDLPGPDARLALSGPLEELPAGSHPLAREVIEAVTTYGRVSEVVDHCTAPDYQVLRILSDLLARELLVPERVGGHSRGPSDGDGDEIFSPIQLRRIQEWAAAQRPQSGPVLKLIVAGANTAVLQGFSDAMRECAEFRGDGRLLREPDRIGGMTTLGYFPVGDGMTLRLLALPTALRYAPLWPVAAHGMLGAIILPAGPYGAALEETEPAFASLQAICPRSVFHLILPDTSGTSLSAGAREQLDALEGGSVFVLPGTPGADRVRVLRNLFSRLIP